MNCNALDISCDCRAYIAQLAPCCLGKHHCDRSQSTQQPRHVSITDRARRFEHSQRDGQPSTSLNTYSMASEAQPSPPRGNTPSIIPTKRTLEDTHTPSVSSPLNPNPPRPYAAPAREPRSKKESLKKREASGTSSKPAAPEKGSKSKKLKDSDDHSLAASPIRYNHPLPPQPWQYTDKETHYISHEPDPIYAPDGIELKKPLDQ